MQSPLKKSSRRIGERGEGKIGCFLWLVLFSAIILFGVKAIPIKMSASRFEDYLIDQAKFAQRTTATQLRERVRRKARELDLPLRDKNIKVRKTPSRVVIDCNYVVPIEFPFYTWNWKFDINVERTLYQF